MVEICWVTMMARVIMMVIPVHVCAGWVNPDDDDGDHDGDYVYPDDVDDVYHDGDDDGEGDYDGDLCSHGGASQHW